MSAIEKAQEALKAKRESGESVERLNPIEKAQKNPKSLRLAINAKCYDCMGQNSDPNVTGRIGSCEIPSCPLWPVRPYQKKKTEESEGEVLLT